MNSSINQNTLPVLIIRRLAWLSLAVGGLMASGQTWAAPAEIAIVPGISAGIYIGIDSGHSLPPPYYERIGRPPFADAFWVPGHWRGDHRRVWHRGHWERRVPVYRERIYWAPYDARYRGDWGDDRHHKRHHHERYDHDR